MKQKTSWDRKCQLNGNTLCSKSSRADLTKWSQAIWPCTHICSWKPKVKPLIPLFLLSFLSLNLTFYLWCIDPKKTISEMPFQRRKTDSIYFWSQRYFHSKSRYLAKSKRLFHNEGIGIEGWQMNRRGLFWGKMGFGPPIWLPSH